MRIEEQLATQEENTRLTRRVKELEEQLSEDYKERKARRMGRMKYAAVATIVLGLATWGGLAIQRYNARQAVEQKAKDEAREKELDREETAGSPDCYVVSQLHGSNPWDNWVVFKHWKSRKPHTEWWGPDFNHAYGTKAEGVKFLKQYNAPYCEGWDQ